jgi:hypothetical protein
MPPHSLQFTLPQSYMHTDMHAASQHAVPTDRPSQIRSKHQLQVLRDLQMDARPLEAHAPALVSVYIDILILHAAVRLHAVPTDAALQIRSKHQLQGLRNLGMEAWWL